MTGRARSVSMVLPSYDGARYLDDAIGSVWRQTYGAWELIVVDDASRDDTRSRAQAWCARDPRIRLVVHDRNRGLPAALNSGFATARGDYLTWTSHDNMLRPDSLAELADRLERRADVDVVYSDYSTIDEGGVVTGSVRVGDPGDLVRYNCVGPSFLYRRRVQSVVGPYAEELALAEDYDFWLRAAGRCRMEPLHRDLYLYRVHGHSLTARYRPGVLAASDAALARSLPGLPWLDERRRAEIFFTLATRALRRGESRAAARRLVAAFRRHPAETARCAVQAVLRHAGRARRG